MLIVDDSEKDEMALQSFLGFLVKGWTLKSNEELFRTIKLPVAEKTTVVLFTWLLSE